MNQVSLIGNLTRDAKIFKLKGDRVLAVITVAINYRKRNGEEGTDYIPVKFVTTEKTAKYLLKGKKVAVSGSLNSYVKDNKTNIIVSANNVQFLSKQFVSSEENGELDIPEEIMNDPF